MLQADPSMRATNTAINREPWYASQWQFFWTVVAAILSAGAIAGLLSLILAAAMTHAAKREIEASAAEFRSSIDEAMAAPAPAYRTVHVPAQDTATCLAQSNGVADESFAQCRRGYTRQERVR